MEKDVVCGMQVDPAEGGRDERLQREDLLLLRESLQNQVRQQPGSMREVTTPATKSSIRYAA